MPKQPMNRPDDGGLSSEALARFEEHLPLLERVISQILSGTSASVRDLTYMGAIVLLRASAEWTEDSGLPFKEYAEVTVTSELLHHLHYPVPVLRLPAELASHQPRLDAMAQALARLQPPPSLALATFPAAYRHAPLAPYAAGEFYGAPPAAQAASGPNVAKLVWGLFKKRLPLILGLALVTELGIAAYTLSAPKTYVAGSTINSGIGAQGPLGGGGDWFTQGTVVANITELLKSRTVLESTAQAMSMEVAPEKLGRRITVSRMGQAGLLKVEAEAETPTQASELVNTLIREFLRYYAGSQSHEARSNKAFFESQVKVAQDRLRGAENRLKEFKGAFVPEMQSDMPARVSELMAQRDETARTLAAARAGLASVQRELAAIKRDPLLTQRLLNNASVLTAGDRLKELQLNLADAKEIYGAGSPVVKGLETQIARAKSQLRTTTADAFEQNPALADATARVVQLKADIAMNGARLASLNRSIAAMQPQARSASTNQVTFEQLQREVKIAETQYMELQTKYGQSNLAAQGASNLTISVVDPAIPPTEPLSSKLALKLFLGLILSMGLGLFISYLMSLREKPEQADETPAGAPAGTPLLTPGLSA